MHQTTVHNVEHSVAILLHVADRVIEVSEDLLMSRIWDRNGSMIRPAPEKYLGKKITDIGSDNILTQCIDSIHSSFNSGLNSTIDYEAVVGAKQVVYQIRILLCHPDPGFLFVTIEDRTANGSIRVAEDKWSLALNASGDGLWDSDIDKDIITFSGKWKEIFGYDHEDIPTLEVWRSKIHPDDFEATMQTIDRHNAGATNVYETELRYICKDGSIKWILSRGIILTHKPDGSPMRMIGTHTDINKRKLAEEQLKISRDTFSNSFNYSGIGKALIAPGGKWLEVNDVVCDLIEYSREELLNMHYRDFTYPPDIDVDIPHIGKLLSGESRSYTIEKRYVSKSRRIITALLTVTLVWESKDKPKYFICDIVDISSNKELVGEINRKNQELEAALGSLKNKIKQVDELNNIIAHNLRGPIGNIEMISGDLLNKVRADENGEEGYVPYFPTKDALDIINSSSASLLSHLEVLVELVQINLNKDIVFEECNVRQVIEKLQNQLYGTIFQKQAQFEFRLGVEVINYPPFYFESILYNLINNALKYSRPDVPPQILITTGIVNGRVQLSVKDNGLGIDMEKYAGEIFKLNRVFHQGFDSKGVGLFITKTQIESLGGTIEFNSKVNEGSELVVVF